MSDHETMVEEFLDCTGKKRRFKLQSYANGMFLSAVELLGQGETGMRFVMKMDHHGHLQWGEMRGRIRARLAERDVAVDPDTGRLEILRGLVRAHIESVPDEDDEQGPLLVVDDRRVTWSELGQLLRGLDSSALRLEIVDSAADL